MENSYIQDARQVFDIEIAALQKLRDAIGPEFEQAIELLKATKGHVICTGVGKSGHIARKIAATMSSLGKAAFSLCPGDALHGDLGMVTSSDVVIAISNSGESDELARMLNNIRLIGASIIALTSNPESSLARYADLICLMPKVEEACHLQVAPTSSATVSLVYGDALAVVLSKALGFTKSDYALFHPAGALGKRLLVCVSDLMHTGEQAPITVLRRDTVDKVLVIIGKNRLGTVAVTDSSGILQGIITHGDLRRAMDKSIDIYQTAAEEIMTENPIVVQKDTLAVDAMMLMRRSGIQASVLPVLEGGTVRGIVTLHDIVGAGIIM